MNSSTNFEWTFIVERTVVSYKVQLELSALLNELVHCFGFNVLLQTEIIVDSLH